MDITKETFASELSTIKSAIDAATFLSIDCEFTGLRTSSNVNTFDPISHYYEEMHKSSMDYLVVQFGLSIFRYEKDTKSYKEKTYNFYLFPHRNSNLLPEQSFLCQASSIDFLVKNGFDFNKLFREGISYLNRGGQEKFEQALDARQAKATEEEDIPVPEDMQELIDNIFTEISSFLKSDEKEHILPVCNAFARRLVYQSLSKRVGNQVALETRQLPNNQRGLVVIRPKTAEELEAARRQLVQEAVGFSELVQYISDSRKPVVGHNMLLDLCHAIDKFLVDLPADYVSFKECANCLFPQVFDTKYIGSLPTFKELVTSTVLNQMVQSLTEEPFKLPLIESELDEKKYSIKNPVDHEAGYDAFITGLAFISMWEYLSRDIRNAGDIFENIDLLQAHCNKLFIMRLQDWPCLVLDGPDIAPSRDHVFHMSFPKDWSGKDINRLFSPFGYVRIAWINETSAYVALVKRNQASSVLSALRKSDVYTIITYAQHRQNLNRTSIAVTARSAPPAARRSDAAASVSTRKRRVSNGDGSADRSNPRKHPHLSPAGNRETVPSLITPTEKKGAKKTFAEDDSWE